ncbi:hypothetical protein IWX90DRAFT_487976 [Phyllosticta citrichinensis]|uniref:Uncharacterized protein n=1 Tax=Phyllosticta citrichinensis TaxID=1130410 RepID=A0ABR1XMZ1_9PEZI
MITRGHGNDWTPPTESSEKDDSDWGWPRKPPKKKSKKPKTRKRGSGGITKLDPPRRKRLKSPKDLKELKQASEDVPQVDPTAFSHYCRSHPFAILKQDPAPIPTGEKVISVDKGKGGVPDPSKTTPGRDRENPVCIEDHTISQASALQSGQEPKDQTTESAAAFEDMDEEELRLKLLDIGLKREEVALKLRLRRLQKRCGK